MAQTAVEKAQELIDKFREYSHTDFNYTRGGYQVDTQIKNAKQCALIAVDEIINVTAPYCNRYEDYYKELKEPQTQHYWQEVKAEIEKL